MFCTKCGNQLPEGAKFCPKCGASVDGADWKGRSNGQKTNQTAGMEIRQELSGPGKRQKKLWLIPVILLAVFVMVGVGLLFGKDTIAQRRYERQLALAERHLNELDYEAAIAAYEKAIEIDPKREDAYLGLTELYAEAGELDKAIEILESGCQIGGMERLPKELAKLEEMREEFGAISMEQQDGEENDGENSESEESGNPVEDGRKEENGVLQPRTDEETAETDMDSADWKRIYLEHIDLFLDEWELSEEGRSDVRYALVYINDDAIPELVMDSGFTYAGGYVMTYIGNAFYSVQVSAYGVSYGERTGLFCDSGGHMDSYSDTVYEIRNDGIEAIHYGEYGAANNSDVQLDEDGFPLYQYYWDGVEQTGAQYQQLLSDAFNSSSSKSSYEESCTYDEVIRRIQNY